MFIFHKMGGIAILMPKIFTMFNSLSMASLVLLGMSGFIAELVIFFGIITSSQYLLIPKIIITFLVAVEIILTLVYLLSRDPILSEINTTTSIFFNKIIT